MSKLDNLLNRYRERTSLDLHGSIEANVMARIQNQRDQFFYAFSGLKFRILALSMGMAIGLMVPSYALTPSETPKSGLAVFSTDAPFLPTSWAGKSK